LKRNFQAVINVYSTDNTIATHWRAHLGCQQSTERTPPADLNGLARFSERRNLVFARVPSHFNCTLVWSYVCL